MMYSYHVNLLLAKDWMTHRGGPLIKTSQELRMLSRSLSDCQSTIEIAVSVVIVVILVSVY